VSHDDLLARLALTPPTLAAAAQGGGEEQLRRRPAERAWSATEIACHLRDVDELFQVRFHTILALVDPPVLVFGARPDDLVAWHIVGAVGHPLDPDRWAEDRQYRRADTAAAVAAFARRRGEIVRLLRGLEPREWERSGVHLRRGRLPLTEWAAGLARHDDNHLDQLRRAPDGRA
jgi:hypothetical protein